MEAKAVGLPKPTIKWYKQGLEVIPSKEFQIDEFEDGTSILTISETYPDDTGEIVFEAHNALGVSTTTTYLNVEGIFLMIFHVFRSKSLIDNILSDAWRKILFDLPIKFLNILPLIASRDYLHLLK